MLNNIQTLPKYLAHHQFLIGIGSNIEPSKNIALALEELRFISNAFATSPVMQTEPVGIQSDHKFLNLVVYFSSHLQTDELKKRLNATENKLGRDRNDPLRKVKDHPIDFDIIAKVTNNIDWSKIVETSEDYYRLPILSLLRTLNIDLHQNSN